MCSSVSVADQDKKMRLPPPPTPLHVVLASQPTGFYLRRPIRRSRRTCGLPTRKTTPTLEDTDMPDDTPPEDTVGSYINPFAKILDDTDMSEDASYDWITPETTSIPEDTDMPDNAPAGATAAPTPDDTAGCYINTQRDAEKSIVKTRPFPVCR